MICQYIISLPRKTNIDMQVHRSISVTSQAEALNTGYSTYRLHFKWLFEQQQNSRSSGMSDF